MGFAPGILRSGSSESRRIIHRFNQTSACVAQLSRNYFSESQKVGEGSQETASPAWSPLQDLATEPSEEAKASEINLSNIESLSGWIGAKSRNTIILHLIQLRPCE